MDFWSVNVGAIGKSSASLVAAGAGSDRGCGLAVGSPLWPGVVDAPGAVTPGRFPPGARLDRLLIIR